MRKHGIEHYLDLVARRPGRPHRHAHAHLPRSSEWRDAFRALADPGPSAARSRSRSTSGSTFRRTVVVDAPVLPKPSELLALHDVTEELFDTLKRWFDVPASVALDLSAVDAVVHEMADPVMIAALAMRKLQALHLLATPGVRTSTDVVVTIVQDLARALAAGAGDAPAGAGRTHRLGRRARRPRGRWRRTGARDRRRRRPREPSVSRSCTPRCTSRCKRSSKHPTAKSCTSSDPRGARRTGGRPPRRANLAMRTDGAVSDG